MLGAPQSPCWPRGFPIEKVLDSIISNENKEMSKVSSSTTKFGVLQSLADIQPDVDAIFRLTHKTPFAFNKGKGDFFSNDVFRKVKLTFYQLSCLFV